MFAEIGVSGFDDLIKNIPDEVLLKKPLDIPDPLSEGEALSHLRDLGKKNIEGVSFVGGGAYDHYTPAVIDTIASRSEFLTAYTPYQPEVSQGTLQVIYEFQTHIARLTGMEVANASMYDGASALAEALVVAVNFTRKKKILLAGGLNPNYLRVCKTYLSNYDVQWVALDSDEGKIDIRKLNEQVDEETAAVVLQQPNYFGIVESAGEIGELMKGHKALFIVAADPNSLGILEAPGNYHADIVVGEGQSLGIPLNYGGPYVGFFAVNKNLIRKIPGRIVGVSEDAKGRKGYLLTLQAREQHIRREKATSNICTNSGLMALAATVYLSWIGKEGLPRLAELIIRKSHYLAEEIKKLEGYSLYYNAPFYKEFVIKTPVEPGTIISEGLKKGIKAGVDISGILGVPAMLVAVTEKRSKAEMDSLVDLLKTFQN
jgi:glycine dehydrogenase subunit 1